VQDVFRSAKENAWKLHAMISGLKWPSLNAAWFCFPFWKRSACSTDPVLDDRRASTVELTSRMLLGMSGRSLGAVEQPVDRHVESRRQLAKRLTRKMCSLPSLDERRMPSRKLGLPVEGTSGKTQALARRPNPIGDLHEDNCTREDKCRQARSAMTDVLAPLDNADVAKRQAEPKEKKTPSAITARVKALADERGISGIELAKKAGLGDQTANKAFKRGSSFSADNLVAIARVLDVPVEHLVGSSPYNTGIEFTELVRWAHSTQGVAQALTLQPRLTVGDLLRYHQSPSSEGEHSGEAVLAQIRGLRIHDQSGGRAVTEEEEADILKMPPKSRRR
jgi:transcriptional regulator with XRE-family HTH domain